MQRSFLGAGLYRKFLDSFLWRRYTWKPCSRRNIKCCRQIRCKFLDPRQSFFINRFLALENYMKRANAIMKLYPISDSKSFKLLNSEEPEPTSASGEWDKR